MDIRATVTKQIQDKNHEILDLCFKLQRQGVDCFYQYYPHIQQADLRIYSNGWKPACTGPDIIIDHIETVVPGKATDELLESEVDLKSLFQRLDKCIETLKGLLKC
ncbi:hypothetical protein Henu6_gp140 [Acinetobacter phage Henu6]|uniref:Uncharacterized protein n=1 Tax=Acinetobacter phage Henu6 TaxID=2500136 RepID=A0A410T5B9_9CAUD|nr:hypothetical protein Henu6_gp140 [Acinetobacter phage Henu6]